VRRICPPPSPWEPSSVSKIARHSGGLREGMPSCAATAIANSWTLSANPVREQAACVL